LRRELQDFLGEEAFREQMIPINAVEDFIRQINQFCEVSMNMRGYTSARATTDWGYSRVLPNRSDYFQRY
jgi:deoxyribodipyrimidine photolyase-like uncharacterized protein